MERISLKKKSSSHGPTISAHAPILCLACVHPDSNLVIAATLLGIGIEKKGVVVCVLTRARNRVGEVDTGKINALAVLDNIICTMQK